VTGRLTSLVVAIEDVWTSLCYPRCPGGHGARTAAPRPAAPRGGWHGRLISCLRFGAGWKGPAVCKNSSGRRHGAVPETQPARRLRMVWATAGIGVCVAADGGAGGHLWHADRAATGCGVACPA
jgi:hypothetical protein